MISNRIIPTTVGDQYFNAWKGSQARYGQLVDEAFAPLPIFKVLYRNTARLQEQGGRKHEALHPVRPAAPGQGSAAPSGEQLRDAIRRKDLDGAEAMFAELAGRGSVDDSFDQLLTAVHDATTYLPSPAITIDNVLRYYNPEGEF